MSRTLCLLTSSVWKAISNRQKNFNLDPSRACYSGPPPSYTECVSDLQESNVTRPIQNDETPPSYSSTSGNSFSVIEKPRIDQSSSTSYYTRQNNLNESISILISPPANTPKISLHTQQNAINTTPSRSARRLHDEPWPIYREDAPRRHQPVQSFYLGRSLITWTDMGFKKEWHGQLIWFTLVLLFFFFVLVFVPKSEGKGKSAERRQQLEIICRELRRAEQEREEQYGKTIVSGGMTMRIFPPDFIKKQGPLCKNED